MSFLITKFHEISIRVELTISFSSVINNGHTCHLYVLKEHSSKNEGICKFTVHHVNIKLTYSVLFLPLIKVSTEELQWH